MTNGKLCKWIIVASLEIIRENHGLQHSMYTDPTDIQLSIV
jgi:hypothetical protein